MADALKHFFDLRVVRSIAADLRRACPAFNEERFTADALRGLETLALTARGAHIADAMRRSLPQDYEHAAQILIESLGPELDSSETFGMEPFRYLPHVSFVARFGLGSFETSMLAQLALTKRFSAESSIRAYLVAYPEQTYARLQEWAHHPNVHVRRLASEGTRPRLPWATRLRDFQKDPSPVIALLELLKDDPERYVQRSVANNLNDIGKDHPSRLVEVCARWSEAPSEGRAWIVKHALRSLVKAGDRGALGLLGVGGKPKILLDQVRVTPARVRIGTSVSISFELVSAARTPQDLMVDYKVHFVKASGQYRGKVFKIRRLSLEGNERVRLQAKLSLVQMTTRKHYPGVHRAELLVNGQGFPLCEFELHP